MSLKTKDFFIAILLLVEAQVSQAAVSTEYNAYVDTYYESFIKKDDYRVDRGVLKLKWQQKVAFDKNSSLNLDLNYRGQTTKQEAHWFNPKQAIFDYKNKAHRVSLGIQETVWESTDLINPFDFIHQKNLRNPLELENVSSASLYYTYSKGSQTFNFLYIPYQFEAVLPGTESAWMPRSLELPVDTTDIALQTQSGFSYSFQDKQVLNEALRHNVGIRYKFTGDQFDFSLVAFEGAKNQPLLMPTLSGTAVNNTDVLTILLDKNIQITPTYYRTRNAGAATTITMGEFILRLAGAYQQPLGEDRKLPGWNHLEVISLEKTFSFSNSMLTAQLLATQGKTAKGASLASISSLMESAVGLGFRYAHGETWTLLSALFYETKTKSQIQSAQLDYKIKDSMKIFTNIYMIEGSQNLLAAAYKDNDFFQAGFKLSY